MNLVEPGAGHRGVYLGGLPRALPGPRYRVNRPGRGYHSRARASDPEAQADRERLLGTQIDERDIGLASRARGKTRDAYQPSRTPIMTVYRARPSSPLSLF
jgi:hypothetical protein